MTVAAIILYYWIERTENVKRLVQDLKRGSVVPEKIIIFNNNPEIILRSFEDVIVINSDYNLYCMARHAIGLILQTDCCLFIDDDLTVKPNAVEYLIKKHERFPESILGFQGRTLGEDQDNPYTSGEYIKGVHKVTKVDIVLGRIHFCKTSKLINSFVLSNKIPDLWYNEKVSDDIILSLSNIFLDDSENYVLPSKMIDLSEEAVGSHYTSDHYHIRNRTCRKILDFWRKEWEGKEKEYFG